MNPNLLPHALAEGDRPGNLELFDDRLLADVGLERNRDMISTTSEARLRKLERIGATRRIVAFVETIITKGSGFRSA
jgi:hypothetical protein